MKGRVAESWTFELLLHGSTSLLEIILNICLLTCCLPSFTVLFLQKQGLQGGNHLWQEEYEPQKDVCESSFPCYFL